MRARGMHWRLCILGWLVNTLSPMRGKEVCCERVPRRAPEKRQSVELHFITAGKGATNSIIKATRGDKQVFIA